MLPRCIAKGSINEQGQIGQLNPTDRDRMRKILDIWELYLIASGNVPHVFVSSYVGQFAPIVIHSKEKQTVVRTLSYLGY